MKVELENVKPMDIEKRSFEIITEELGDTELIPGTELIEVGSEIEASFTPLAGVIIKK